MSEELDAGSYLGSSAKDKGIKKIDHRQDARSKNAKGLLDEIMAMMKIVENPETTGELRKRTQRKLDIYNSVFIEKNPQLVVSEKEAPEEMTSLETDKIPIFHPKTNESVPLDKLKDARKTMEEVFDIAFKQSSSSSPKELREYWSTTGREYLLDTAAPFITSAGNFRRKFKQAAEGVIREIIK